MTFPFASLAAEYRQPGLIIATLIGFGFGFVLERAGFGRSTKLAAQFYLREMTVLKVMFSGIVTAMLGLVVISGFGLADLAAISRQIASETFVWPMVVGGIALGAGFIISGYCPGTSVVAAASGHVDGWFAVAGVVLGSLIYDEIQPAISGFHSSGALGSVFLHELLHVPAPLLALAVVAMAVSAFVGAEKLERIFSNAGAHAESAAVPDARGRRFAFVTFAAIAMLGTATLLVPRAAHLWGTKAQRITPSDLAHRILDEPWKIRILDLREGCANQRIPGSECVSADVIERIGLQYAPASRDLIVIPADEPEMVPPAAAAYQGRVCVLGGGFAAWKDFALTRPEIPEPNAPESLREAYAFRARVFQAMTGRKQVPAPAAAPVSVTPPKKKAGGSCS